MFHHSLPNLSSDVGTSHRPLPPQARLADWSDQALERTWRSVGRVCVLIGLVNAFIPVMPTTVFLLLGLWAYGKGDPALAKRLLCHPRFGRSLRLWVNHRQITRRGKYAAIAGMGVSGLATGAMLGARPLTWVVVAGLMILAAYLATREEPSAPL